MLLRRGVRTLERFTASKIQRMPSPLMLFHNNKFRSSSTNKYFSNVSRSQRRAARRKSRQKQASSGVGAPALVLGAGTIAICGAGYYFDWFSPSEDVGAEIQAEDGTVYNPAKEGAGTFAAFVHRTMDYFRGDQEETNAKLLPDYENSFFFQEGAPPPLTLVIDLEETLGTSTWSRKHGWRFVKRPNLDYFLQHVAKCGYEVVIFSTNPSVGAVEDTLALLDPHNQLAPYKLYCNSAKFQDNKYVKDLSNLNRDFKQVIVVDDKLEDVVTNQENLIVVKPFDDIQVLEDDTLIHLAKYLEHVARGFSQKGITDVRSSIRRFQSGHEEGEPDFLHNFKDYIDKEERIKEKKRKQGLGGQLRKTNILQAKPAQKPRLTYQPASIQQNPVSFAAGTGPHKYRKTIWERMTDPEAAAKQDKELQDKERQWQSYVSKVA